MSRIWDLLIRCAEKCVANFHVDRTVSVELFGCGSGSCDGGDVVEFLKWDIISRIRWAEWLTLFSCVLKNTLRLSVHTTILLGGAVGLQ